MIETDPEEITNRQTGEDMERESKTDQGTGSFCLQQEHDHGSAVDVWLGANPAQRQALAAWLLQQWQQEAEQLMAQRRYQKAIAVYTRMLVVDPEHAQALHGRAQAYRQVGVEQATARDARTPHTLLSPKQSGE
jgi:tetratricopeptide (TPR) repeat protein